MVIEVLKDDFIVCKVDSMNSIDFNGDFLFIGKTDEEISVVCNKLSAPTNMIAIEDNWKAFRIKGELDFSLVGILSDISSKLAENHISIFAISTFNTDYVLVKLNNLEKSIRILKENGYTIES